MSTDLLPLRPYQNEAIVSVLKAWGDGMRRPAVVLPTGMGKTVIFSHLIKQHHAATGRRSVVLVHRDELVDQALDKIRMVAPHLYVGRVKAAADHVNADVVVASVQTLASPRRLEKLLTARAGRPALWITDECHHGLAPSYQRIYQATADADHVGFTATLARSDGKGLGAVWDDVVFTRSIAYAVQHGFLVQPEGRTVSVGDLDLKGVSTSRGDYSSGDLGEALENSGALVTAADAYRQHAADRSGIAFCPTVETAADLAGLLTARGLPAAVISGATPRTERRAIYEAFRTGRIRVLSSCMVLTEGFDAPWASAALMVRPTKSNPLYIQMVGRVLRPFPGKRDALVLDIVGAGQENKIQTLIDLEDGFWPEKKPCEKCLCLPCACICDDCGKLKPCDCPTDWAPPVLTAVGKGGTFDLFAESNSTWGMTPGGVNFIGCGDPGYVFLWPAPGGVGLWDVWVAPMRDRVPLKFAPTDHRGLTLEAAMSWAEAEAEDVGGTLARRSSRWRSQPASPAQLQYAARQGIPTGPGITKGQVSDLLDAAQAARIFDPYIGMEP